MRVASCVFIGLLAAATTIGAEESVFVLLDCQSIEETRSVVRLIEDGGGRVRHVFPNAAIIADGAHSGLESNDHVLLVTSRPTDLEQLDGLDLSESALLAATAWSRSVESIPDLSRRGSAEVAEVVSDRDARWAICDSTGTGTALGAFACDTSEYMIGTVSVALLFPESDGSIDPSSEDWTPEEEADVTAGVISALDWWTDRAAEHSAPMTFWYVTFTGLATGYEPITHPLAESQLWMNQCYDALGVEDGPIHDRAVAFANSLRDSLSTDWAYVAWVHDSSNDVDGKFADGYFALSTLGGAYLVTTYDNGAWTIDYYDVVFAHETGHIFYALDQYGSCECTAATGYLNVENQNCWNGCLGDEPNSIMSVYYLPLSGFVVDHYAAGQVGWWDGDTNGVPDILDTHPLITLPTRPPNTTVAGPHEYAGSTVVNPLPNLNPHGEQNDISVNEIVDVKWRVDDGLWASAVATDGAFDSGEEGFSFATDTLAVGTHVIEVVAMNNVGNYSEETITDTVTVVDWVGVPESTVGRQIVLHASSPNPFSDLSVIRYTLPRAGEVTLEVHNMAGRRVRQLVRGELQCAGGHVVSWNGRDDRGRPVASGVYFCRLVMGSDSVARKMIQLQ